MVCRPMFTAPHSRTLRTSEDKTPACAFDGSSCRRVRYTQWNPLRTMYDSEKQIGRRSLLPDCDGQKLYEDTRSRRDGFSGGRGVSQSHYILLSAFPLLCAPIQHLTNDWQIRQQPDWSMRAKTIMTNTSSLYFPPLTPRQAILVTHML